MNIRQQKRLLNVAKALREGRPENFDMSTWGHYNLGGKCGTPACALGHYASRRDLQKACTLTISGDLDTGDPSQDAFEFAVEHFGITSDEAEELFDPYGCGNAKTNKQAAAYIEKFVQRKARKQERVRALTEEKKALQQDLKLASKLQNRLDDVETELYELGESELYELGE